MVNGLASATANLSPAQVLLARHLLIDPREPRAEVLPRDVLAGILTTVNADWLEILWSQ